MPTSSHDHPCQVWGPHPSHLPPTGQELSSLRDQVSARGAKDEEEGQQLGGVPSLEGTLPQPMVRVSVLLQDREVCKDLHPAKGYAGCIPSLSPNLGLQNDEALRSGSEGSWQGRGGCTGHPSSGVKGGGHPSGTPPSAIHHPHAVCRPNSWS